MSVYLRTCPETPISGKSRYLSPGWSVGSPLHRPCEILYGEFWTVGVPGVKISPLGGAGPTVGRTRTLRHVSSRHVVNETCRREIVTLEGRKSSRVDCSPLAPAMEGSSPLDSVDRKPGRRGCP